MNARDLGEQTLWCPESASASSLSKSQKLNQTKVIQIVLKGGQKKNLKQKTLLIYVQRLTWAQDQNLLGA